MKIIFIIVSFDGVVDFKFFDEVEFINKYVFELKVKGVDVIIVLIYEGGVFKDGFDKFVCGILIGFIVNIVNKFDFVVDVVISGYIYQGYNCVVNGCIVIQGDYYGYLLQCFDMIIDF